MSWNIPWVSVAFHGVPWLLLASIYFHLLTNSWVHASSSIFYNLPQCSVTFRDIPWHSVTFCNIPFWNVLQGSVRFRQLPRYSGVFYNLPWCSVGFQDVPWCSFRNVLKGSIRFRQFLQHSERFLWRSRNSVGFRGCACGADCGSTWVRCGSKGVGCIWTCLVVWVHVGPYLILSCPLSLSNLISVILSFSNRFHLHFIFFLSFLRSHTRGQDKWTVGIWGILPKTTRRCW